MRKNNLLKKGIALAMMVTMLSVSLTGCKTDGTGENQAVETTTTVNASAAIEEIKAKYQGSVADYSGDIITVKRDEAIEVKLGFNPWENETSIYEDIMIYKDAEMTQPLDIFGCDYDDSTGIYTIEPPFYGVAEMDGGEVDLSDLSGNYLYGNDDQNSWGNLSQYYMVTKVNLETGEQLEKPQITVIKVNAEISQAPQFKFTQTENGEAKFYWQPVEGAKEYLVFKINDFREEIGLDEMATVVARTTDAEWVCESDISDIDLGDGSVFGVMNMMFEQYYLSDDSASEADFGAYDEYYSEYYGVIAVNENGASVISNLMSAKDLSHMLPNTIAHNTNEESYSVATTLDLPATLGVVMCDGTVTQKVLDYDFDNITKKEYGGYDVVATVEGTIYKEVISVQTPNLDTLEADFATIEERQEKLGNEGGNIEPSVEIEAPAKEEEPVKEEQVTEGEEPEVPETEIPVTEEAEPEKTETELPDEMENVPEADLDMETPVTANSALSEYIARNLLVFNETIDISAFPESTDSNVVIDSFFEAIYQNPLALGVKGFSMDRNYVLYVEYDDDADTALAKQQEVADKVSEVVAEIITDDMSDLEKNHAINQYLCDNSEYDYAALENAEANNFYGVDEEFNDSFTAYGCLVNGIGVCASYAADYKLLADAAGLDSIVVTGYLEGATPHAWNKVCIDGEWTIVDSTNNDNEIISNALLNISDTAASAVLVEDEEFVLDNMLTSYAANSNAYEYYQVMGSYYEQDVIANKLAAGLQEEGMAVLRTDYDLNDDEFTVIAQAAANAAQTNIGGLHWMGVVYLLEQ